MNHLASRSRRRSRSTPQERADWVRRYEQSGVSRQEFSRRHHLRLTTLQRWIARTRANGASTPARASGLWQELKWPCAPVALPWAVELVRPDGLTMRLTSQAPVALVAKLLRVRSC